MKRMLAVLLALAMAQGASGELHFAALSVTETSQTYPLPKPSAVVGLCNLGTDEAYFRVFSESDTAAAATTAHSVLPAGTAAAPYCLSLGKSPTEAAYISAISIVCDTGETATVHVQAW